ncbi:MAG: Fic family protein [Epsilonproteobacteria bacterium]|nr:MAG: Fic family protein [Campylobacterota bacterium]
MLTKKQTIKIDELRKEYFQYAIGKEQLLRLISETEVFEQVYNSNAIENSTLSIEETEKILLQIDLDRYVSEREIYEAKNLARVTEYINNNAKDKELSSEMMLFLHKILISNIDNDIAGRFREGDEYVRVGSHIAPAPSQIAEGLEQTFMTYKADTSKNIVERIARFHLDFETIHPFIDGNGRIGRSLNNYLLIREEYVPINIRFLDRQEYYRAFQEFNMSDKTDIMQKIIYGALVNSYHKRLAYLKGLNIMTLSAYAKTHKLSHSNLINKAKRHTIPAFMVKGVWMMGDE